MYCEECGKELTGNEEKCPNCGKVVNRKSIDVQQTIDKAQEGIEKATVQLAKEVSVSNYVLKLDELIFYISALVAMIGCFFPFMAVSIFGRNLSVSYVSGDGLMVIALLVVGCVLLYFKKSLGTLILSVLSLIVILYDFFNSSQYTTYGAHHGLGAYLVLIGCLVCVVMSVSIFTRKKKEKK